MSREPNAAGAQRAFRDQRRGSPRPAATRDSRRAPYGRGGGHLAPSREAPGSRERAPGASRDGAGGDGAYADETYYDRPALKAPGWGWLISSYFFIGGMAGALQVLGTVADLVGGGAMRGVVRRARYLALACVSLCPVFLILDLETPSRWHHMMRIFRRTSAMSIGAWVLGAFGTATAAVAVAQAGADLFGSQTLRRLARLGSLPAAALGAVMACYTGTLLAATSVPLWSTAHRWLAPLFGASAASGATAALGLTGRGDDRRVHEALGALSLVVAATELGLSAGAEHRWSETGTGGPLRRGAPGAGYGLGGVGLGMLAGGGLHLASLVASRRSDGTRGRRLATLASVATLAGGYAHRAGILFGGRGSVAQPRDYFRITQPDGVDGAAHDQGARA